MGGSKALTVCEGVWKKVRSASAVFRSLYPAPRRRASPTPGAGSTRPAPRDASCGTPRRLHLLQRRMSSSTTVAAVVVGGPFVLTVAAIVIVPAACSAPAAAAASSAISWASLLHVVPISVTSVLDYLSDVLVAAVMVNGEGEQLVLGRIALGFLGLSIVCAWVTLLGFWVTETRATYGHDQRLKLHQLLLASLLAPLNLVRVRVRVRVRVG